MIKNSVLLICLSLLAISCAYPHSNSPININIHDTGVCVCVCPESYNLYPHSYTLCTSLSSEDCRTICTIYTTEAKIQWLPQNHDTLLSVILVGNSRLIYVLRRKGRGGKPQTKEKQEKGGWIFHRFYYFSGKAPRKSDKHRPQLENRKAVWQADKAWGSDTPHPMYKTTQQTHYHLYETTGSQEGAGAVTQCIHIKKKWW